MDSSVSDPASPGARVSAGSGRCVSRRVRPRLTTPPPPQGTSPSDRYNEGHKGTGSGRYTRSRVDPTHRNPDPVLYLGFEEEPGPEGYPGPGSEVEVSGGGGSVSPPHRTFVCNRVSGVFGHTCAKESRWGFPLLRPGVVGVFPGVRRVSSTGCVPHAGPRPEGSGPRVRPRVG